MKLKTIFTIFFMAVILFACTSEDDVLNDMDKTETPGIVTGDKMAYVSFNIGGVQARAAQAEITINSVVYFLLEGNNIIGWADNDSKVLTKVRKNLTVLAIANASQATTAALKEQSTLSGLRSVELSKEDLDAMIKVNGEPQAVEFTVEGVSSTPDKYQGGEYPTEEVTIKVDQVTSCVEFSSFEAVYAEGVSDEFKTRVKKVELKSCRLLHANQSGYLKNIATYKALEYNLSIIDNKIAAIDGGNVLPDKAFLTFANKETGLNATALEITYKIDGKEEKTSTFKIKQDGIMEPYGVVAGKKYGLQVKVTVSDKAEMNINWKVSSWRPSVNTNIEFN